MDSIFVREETAADVRAIDVVNISAFASENEAKLVSALRQSAGYISELSLIAESHNRIVGHILLTTIGLFNAQGERKILSLAPMSVVPSQSHRGIGSALVRAAIAKAGSLGYPGIVVVGHPEFYKRFGFDSAEKWQIRCPLPVPGDAVTALELSKGGFAGGGALRYPQVMLDFYASAGR